MLHVFAASSRPFEGSGKRPLTGEGFREGKNRKKKGKKTGNSRGEENFTLELGGHQNHGMREKASGWLTEVEGLGRAKKGRIPFGVGKLREKRGRKKR